MFAGRECCVFILRLEFLLSRSDITLTCLYVCIYIHEISLHFSVDDTMIKFLTVFLPTIDIPAENSATLKIDTISRLFCDKEVCLNNYLV